MERSTPKRAGCATRRWGAGALLAMFAAAPYAQESQPGEEDADDAASDVETEEVLVVTGSRIVRANLVSSSPVTQVEAEELLFQGTVRVEDMARTLPQVYSDQNSSQSNGATGTATLNLRNLGRDRTLVLINGRRMPVGSPLQAGGADINQIPGALIRGVEVLTGGASATYGSDAVAGVVNFLMKDNFEGFRFDYQYSGYSHDNDASEWQQIVRRHGYPVADGNVTDGEMSYASVLFGGNFDNGRGNVTAYGTYRDIGSVLQSGRDYSSCALSDDTKRCFGSSTIPQGRFTNFGAGGLPAVDFIVAGDQFVARSGETFNYGPLNYYQRPDEQYSMGAFARYDLDERAEAYAELMYMDDHTVSQIAPSGAFFVTNSISCANPLMTEQQFQAVCGDVGLTREDRRSSFWIGRRNVEGGNRQQDLRHTTFRAVLGARGELNASWRYDASFTKSEVSMENTYLNDLGTTKIRRALDAVRDDDGQIVCRSVVDGSDPNCVPWNIFREGGVTQAALDYIVLPLFARGTTDSLVLSAYVEGDLTEYGLISPAADSGVAVVLGWETRQENMDFIPDEGFRNGEGAGQGGATEAVGGGYDVDELFFETNIPLVEGRPYAQELTLDLAYRYSDYDYGVTANTFGIRSGWALNYDIKMRASYQKAIRGANVRELFQPQGFNLFDMTGDPCGGPVTNGRTAEGRTFEECARSGVTQAQFGNVPHSPAGQYNFLQGGNPNLEPEEAATWSVGMVWSPSQVDGLTLSLDYWQIRIEEGISNITPEFILTQCLDGNLEQCRGVKRGAPGDLWIGSNVDSSGHIVALQDNLAIEEVRGYDLVADYSFSVGDYGAVSIANVTSFIDTWDQQELASAPVVSCAGTWGALCGYPTPDVRNKLRAIWTTPWNLSLTAMWRFLSEVDDRNETNIDLDATSYLDASGIWDVRPNLQLRAGVSNLMDVDPPIAGNGAGPSIAGNGNTFPGMYDALGRYWFVAAGVQF